MSIHAYFKALRKIEITKNPLKISGLLVIFWRRKGDCSAFALSPRKPRPSLYSGPPSASCASNACWSNPWGFVHTPSPNKNRPQGADFLFGGEGGIARLLRCLRESLVPRCTRDRLRRPAQAMLAGRTHGVSFTPLRQIKTAHKGRISYLAEKGGLLGFCVACEFRFKLDTHSTANWTAIPAQTGQ